MGSNTNRANVVNSFDKLVMVEAPDGSLQITTEAQAKVAAVNNDPLSYLNNSIDLLNAFRSQAEDHWLRDDDKPGIVSKTVFLEGGWLSDWSRAFLAAQGFETEWLANQGLMMKNALMFGIPKHDLIILAKCLDSEGNLKHNKEVTDKSIHAFAKNCISDIWVWQEDESLEAGGKWMVHMDLVKPYSYNHLTDSEEGAVVAYYQKKLAAQGFRIVSGFNTFKHGFRYCMVMKNYDMEGVELPVDDLTRSIWNSANRQVKMGWPRFL